MSCTRETHTNLYMLNLTQQNKLMLESTTPDEYFAGSAYDASQKSHWWTITTHPAGAPLNLDGERQSQKNSSLFGQAYHWTCCTNIYQKKINHTWAPSSTAKMPQINTGKGYPFISRFITRLVPTIHEVRRHQSCLLQDSGSLRENLYGPNRKFPSYIKQGQ